VQTVIGGSRETERGVQSVVGEFGVIGGEEIARAGHAGWDLVDRTAAHIAVARIIRIHREIGIWRDAYVLGIARAERIIEGSQRGDDRAGLIVADPVSVPQLAIVSTAIAAKKLVTVGRFDYAQRRVGPSEGVIRIVDGGLGFGAGFGALGRRGDGAWPGDHGLANLSDGLSGGSAGRKLREGH